MKVFLAVLGVLLLTVCGYKPSSHYIKQVFADAVYVDVKVDAVEPENAPFIKDEMNRLVYTRFKGRVTSEALAENKIEIRYAGSNYIPLAYDENGYVTRYRANIIVRFKMETKQGQLSKTISSIVESDIRASSFTSSALKIEAIRKGLGKALDQFLAYVSAKGLLEEKRQTAAAN